jgi:hypothetical protein
LSTTGTLPASDSPRKARSQATDAGKSKPTLVASMARKRAAIAQAPITIFS